MFPQVLALDITGHPHSWISWEDAICLKVKDRISYEYGNGDILARGGVSRMTGEQSRVTVSSIIALKEKFKPRDKIVLTNPNLFQRDLCMCGYCGKKFREDKLTRDHIVPRSRGGKDVWTNVITACKACNNYKDDNLLSEIDMELLFVPYVPSPIEGLILKNRRILADQMSFLQAYLPKHSRLLQH